ncbi:MAG TPA: RluA family pseudouridine synthase [Planctomycetota bacterium]|nr:RluA family pseudouridine synthase [Planctomycetota bacterium]
MPERQVVRPDEDGLTLLELLSERLAFVSTSGLRRVVRAGGATVNDREAAEDRVLHEGDTVEIEVPEDDDSIVRFEPRKLEGFSVLYEDERCLACAKPAGTAVIAERGSAEAPFLGAVLHHLMQRGGAPPRPRVIHRIDKETSGVVLIAKDRDALRALSEQFEGREVAKEYLALVQGEPAEEQDSGEIDLPIGPSERGGRKQRTGGKEAKPARTTWEVAERFRGFTLLRVRPETGRQHQIRVHLEAIGFPLAVDPLYGGAEGLLLSKIKPGYRAKEKETPLIGRLSLHAAKISFRSPAGHEVEVAAPLPHDFEVALKQLRKYADPTRRRSPRRQR